MANSLRDSPLPLKTDLTGELAHYHRGHLIRLLSSTSLVLLQEQSPRCKVPKEHTADNHRLKNEHVFRDVNPAMVKAQGHQVQTDAGQQGAAVNRYAPSPLPSLRPPTPCSPLRGVGPLPALMVVDRSVMAEKGEKKRVAPGGGLYLSPPALLNRRSASAAPSPRVIQDTLSDTRPRRRSVEDTEVDGASRGPLGATRDLREPTFSDFWLTFMFDQ
ncbi:unnamed protein product [Pleuronectes platessa]|uniref:Uncharacterized protein n=1 Tax=Pleuronectes platessa TaxID=8262 RepID=A0A9N7U9R4_PLEPL|nr:unnamed protein product [Pleuronectes platessa]